ncbi:hypothetical protein LG200_02505 [Methylobacillus caricis]|uniref:hypothetical protein n=1 Tax=Methylobacillus caricis TaxID=1971611 RepID=UPI001D0007B5|nr:hypothetical protein [Methylobacillus caricis]MCB5186873.1 hypothetical protein [Methylobacillus caricis]
MKKGTVFAVPFCFIRQRYDEIPVGYCAALTLAFRYHPSHKHGNGSLIESLLFTGKITVETRLAHTLTPTTHLAANTLQPQF